MQFESITTIDLQEVDIHAKRAWALTSMLMTYVDHELDGHLGKQEMSETLASIWEHLDAIGAEFHKEGA